jgi:uroporphyrinogen-III synthase
VNPLVGKRILVTRPRHQAEELCNRLSALGAEPILLPALQIVPPEDTTELDRAIKDLAANQWVIFTSANGVDAFWARMTGLGLENSIFSGIRVGAIGPATARELSERGVEPAFIPPKYIAEEIVAGIGDVSGQRILLPRADIARKTLARELEKKGAIVTEVAAYRTLPADPDKDALKELVQGVDIITFTSSSTVRNFSLIAGGVASRLINTATIACIGPITAHTAREIGYPVHVIAQVYTTEGLIQALDDYLSKEGAGENES